MRIELLVGASSFWERLRRDIETAQERILIQAMTFEGDSVGLALTRALCASTARDRRLLVDSFSKYTISDHFLLQPGTLGNAAILAEYTAGRRAVSEMRASGTRVRFTNPVGPLMLWLPARNHKKMMLIDSDVAYLGGINFSEHNFSWHDMMLRVESRELTDFLADDFMTTWTGRNNSRSLRIGSSEFLLCNGGASTALYERLFSRIAAARSSIFVHSPYVTFPLVDRLKLAARRGVEVTIITPEANNKPTIKEYLVHETANTGIRLLLLEGRMSHLKSVLIDDRYLIAGSSNFDFVSYHVEQELIAVFDDPVLAARFRERVLQPDLIASHPAGSRASWKGAASKLVLRSLQMYCRAIEGWCLNPAE